MSINGGFFGTSDGGGGGNRRGGAGWLFDGAAMAYSRAYRRYHVLPSVLGPGAGVSHKITFQFDGAASLHLGEQVRVHYLEDAAGVMNAVAVS